MGLFRKKRLKFSQLGIMTVAAIATVGAASGCTSGTSSSTPGFENAMKACSLVGLFVEAASNGTQADTDKMSWAFSQMIPEARAAGRMDSNKYGRIRDLANTAERQASAGDQAVGVSVVEMAIECQDFGMLQ